MAKVLIVFGTRPEAIKMAPLIKAFEHYKDDFDVKICVSAQHRDMLDQVLSIFDIQPDYDLDVMQPGQSLHEATTGILDGMQNVLKSVKPDLVLVQGDTTTTFTTALAAFYEQIPVGHIEAGLRTHTLYSPWPEEGNRRLTGVLAHYHFAPTETNRQHLLKENHPDESIKVTGNTVIDALLWVLERIKQDQSLADKIQMQLQDAGLEYNSERRFILVTGHRRESFGEAFVHICQALRQLAHDNPEVDIIYPVHLNPNVQSPVREILSDVDNIQLIDPVPYQAFVYLMSQAYFIVTDSGGIQEEAPSLNKPVLVTRQSTERTEAVDAGTVKLVGTQQNVIMEKAQRLLDDKRYYQSMSQVQNPYGDGQASQRIIQFLKEVLNGA